MLRMNVLVTEYSLSHRTAHFLLLIAWQQQYFSMQCLL